MRDVPVRQGEIALGQLLQFAGLVDTGGQAKQLLLSDEVLVNDEPESRRGRKLHEGDTVEVTGQEPIRITVADAEPG
jgi:ribosome-associated protein